MNGQFFGALLAFMVVPLALSRLLRLDQLFPLVFVQLMCGLAIHLSGLDTWLQAHGVPLASGVLVDSLRGLGGFGVVLLIALTAADSAPAKADRGAWRFVPISVFGFAGSCAFGTLVAWNLIAAYPQLKGGAVGPLGFSLATGLALSVTALPVLIALLHQTGMSESPLGKLAVNCALLDDLWMWLGLSLVLSMVATRASSPLFTMALLGAYLIGMLAAVRPLLRRWADARQRTGEADGMFACVCIVLASAALTDLIGVHAIFGAFIGGVVLPRSAVDGWRQPALRFAQTLLLPSFFILTGMRLHFDASDPSFWQLTAIVTSTAIAGKVASVALVARATRLPWRQSFALGSLLQCKGLMELVAINILFDAGVIGAQMFSALAVMALVCTLVTVPLTRLLVRQGRGEPTRVRAAVAR